MIDPTFLHQLDAFKLALKKKTNAKFKGEQESKLTGEGLLFKEYKEYAPGDDIRYIDWRIYARTEKLFIKKFEEEKNLTFHILVDSSNSMNFGKDMKFEYAAKIGLGIAYLASKENMKFEFSLFSNTFDTLCTRQLKPSIMTIIDRLNSAKPTGDTEFEKVLGGYEKRINSKSLIVIISDFLFEVGELEDVISKLKRNDILLVQILSEKERRLLYEGDSILKDSETGSLLHTYISQRLRKNYLEELQEHIDQIEQTAKRQGANFLTTTTSVPFFETFYTIFRFL